MFSVFFDNRLKMSEQIKALQQCAGSDYTRTLFAGPEDEPLYILKPEVLHILEYVNKKILYELPRIKNCSNVQWIGVRIRIASSMLNKIEQRNILSKDICIEYHNRMTSRVREIVGAIWAEDLPF